MSFGEEDRTAVLTAFALDAAERARRIEQLLAGFRELSAERAAAAIELLAFEAHALRGAAATVARDDIAGLAADLEDATSDRDADSTERRGAIVQAGEQVLEQLRAIARAHRSSDEAGSERASGDDRPIILHVEDNLSNLKLVERILQRRPDVELRDARTGSEGLALAASLGPSLVLLDLRLPDMPGEELLHRLRENAVTRDIPIVVVSAEARPSEADRILAGGADDFLVKPIDVGAFLELVDRMLARAPS